MSYCIIKNIQVENKITNTNKILPVILLDNQDEVLEFENFDEAKNLESCSKRIQTQITNI